MIYLLIGFLPALTLNISTSRSDQNLLETISLPPGFEIELYATDVVNARAMALGDNGTLFVGSRSAGKIYALVDENEDMYAEKMYVISER